MGKAKREAKKARKKDKELQAQLVADAERQRTRRRVIVLAIPLATAALAAGLWFGVGSQSIVGAVILGGAVVWLLAGLGYLGASVRPRDRKGAGAIDFGSRK